MRWILSGKSEQLEEHQAGKGLKVKACHRFGEPFVITGEPQEPGYPGEAALDNPAAGQQHEGALGLG